MAEEEKIPTSSRVIPLNGCVSNLDSFFKNWKNDKRNTTGGSGVLLSIPDPTGENVILEIDTKLYNLDIESYVKNNWDMYEALNDAREAQDPPLPRKTQEEVIAELKEQMLMSN